MRPVPTLVFALLLASLAPGMAAASDNLIVRESKHSVAETIDRLAKAVEAAGAKVVARVDHAKAAKAAGMELRPTEVLLFGNPKLGTPLMQSNPRIGLELPMKAVAWADAGGKVWLGYTDAASLKSRFSIADKDEVFKTMAGALAKFAEAATQ